MHRREISGSEQPEIAASATRFMRGIIDIDTGWGLGKDLPDSIGEAWTHYDS
jgi:hypothetical protein